MPISFPSNPSLNQTFTTNDGNFYRYNGKGWVRSNPNFNCIGSGTITGNLIALNTITGNLIANSSITNNLIALGAITGNLIANLSIDSIDIANLAVTSEKLNLVNGLNTSGLINITYTGSGLGSLGSITIAGYNSRGGAGYHDFIKVTNGYTSNTNPNKHFRLNSSGGFEIINSAYSAMLFSISDAGVVNAAAAYTVNGKKAVNGPAFRAYVDTNQTISSGSQQKVTFGAENFDTDGCFSSSRFTPTAEGYYQLNAVVRIGGNSSTGEVMLILYKNGSEYARGTNASGQEQGSFYSMSISDIAYANGTTDYFEIYIQQTSGSNKDTTAGSPISHFSGSMIRGA